jgi:hypothetical protein
LAECGKDSNEEGSNIVSSSFSYGLCLSALAGVFLMKTGHVGWAWGFSVGAGLSLISLYSLGILVPRLMMPNAPEASQFMLALVLFLKLPLYAVALYAVTRMHGVDARSAFPGILMAPLVISGRTIGALVWQWISEILHVRQIRRGGARILRSSGRRIAAPITSEPAREQG